ncbi:MAG: hypothetical protein KatS3mg074_509 [Meiothermus sp.]|nr:MAG: hypothetical protein KatS3mg074_509 [Meiothermus sp.]
MSLPKVLERIDKACRRASRDPQAVRLVAVTKEHPVAEIRERVLRYGRFPLGESRIQEALPKMDELVAEWHFIGPLQRNKARFAVRFELIHSIDSVRLAETVARKAMENGKVQRVLLELNLGREPQKHGFLEEELPEALAQISCDGGPAGRRPDDGGPLHRRPRDGAAHFCTALEAGRPVPASRAEHGHVGRF